MPPSSPISPKVSSATVAAAVTTLVMYVIGQVPFVAAMPAVVQGALLVLVSAGATFGAGYLRTDPLRAIPTRRYVDKKH